MSRNGAFLALVAAAAVLLWREHARPARAPVRGAEFQLHLEALSETLAPLEQWLAPDEPLRYLRPLDGRGQPLFDEDVFYLVQAAVAPRPLTRDAGARHLLVHEFVPEARQLVPGLERARVLVELGGGFALAVVEEP